MTSFSLDCFLIKKGTRVILKITWEEKTFYVFHTGGPSLTPSLAGIYESHCQDPGSFIRKPAFFLHLPFSCCRAQRPTVEDPFLARFGLSLWCIDYSSVSHQIARTATGGPQGMFWASPMRRKPFSLFRVRTCFYLAWLPPLLNRFGSEGWRLACFL